MHVSLRSFAFLGGQRAPRASDGIGVRVLYRCGTCRRIWFQDGPRIALDLSEAQIQALAQEVAADLAHLPTASCRLCLFQASGGATEIDEYGQGAGWGFSWEYPHPHLVHAMLTIHACSWLAQQPGPPASFPDVVTRPERMRATLAWFVELRPPRRFHLLPPFMLQALKTTNPPGFGQQGTKTWQWQGGKFEADCPPLGGRALLMLVMAQPAARPFSFPRSFSTWQSLAFLTLLGSVTGESRP